jgi:hypothetical protein
MAQDHTFLGRRGETACSLKIADLYRLYVDRAQYIRPDSDIDASAQAFCREIEKAMGIYPNVPDLVPVEPSDV